MGRSGLWKVGWEKYVHDCAPGEPFCLKESGEFLPEMATGKNLQLQKQFVSLP